MALTEYLLCKYKKNPEQVAKAPQVAFCYIYNVIIKWIIKIIQIVT